MITFYFYLLLYKFHDIFECLSIILLGVCALRYTIRMLDYNDHPFDTYVKRFLIGGIVSLFIMTILPNQQESYILTGVYALKQGANSELGQKMIQKLNQELEESTK